MLFHIYLASQILATSLTIPEEMPSSFPAQAVGEFLIIDPSIPPLDGVWMNWDDARRFAHDLDSERNDWKKFVYRQQRDFSLSKKESPSLPLDYNNNEFWNKWGFPIGIGIGIILSVGIGVAVIEATKGK